VSKVWISAVALLTGCFGAPNIIGQTGGGSGGGGSGGQGGGTGGSASNPDAGLAFKTACTTLVEKRCGYFVRCGLLEESPAARSDCAAWLSATWCGAARWPAHVEGGLLTYDPLAGQSCADAFATRACEDYETLPTVCGRLTAPNSALYHACYDGYLECTEGVCRGAACPARACPSGRLEMSASSTATAGLRCTATARGPRRERAPRWGRRILRADLTSRARPDSRASARAACNLRRRGCRV
jgi:hypothetical protein